MTTINLLATGASGAFLGAAFAIGIPAWLARRPLRRVIDRLQGIRQVSKARLPNPSASPDLFGRARKGRLGQAWLRVVDGCGHVGGPAALRLLVMAGGLAASGSLVILHVMGPLPVLLAALLPAAAVAVAVRMTWAYLQRRWQIAFLNHFAEAVDLVTRAVRSGIPVSEAIRTAGHEVNEPVRGEFERIAYALDLGIGLKEALRTAANRVSLPDFDFLVVALVIQRESGGHLAETLDGLSTILRRRKELRLKARALTAEGRMSAAIVGAMPLVAGVAMYALDPSYIARLFESPTGRMMAYGAAACLVLGTIVVRHMTRMRP